MAEFFAFCFFVPGKPFGKERPRVARVGAYSRVYTPAKTVAYEGVVRDSAQVAMNRTLLMEGPLWVRLRIRMPIPESWPVKKKQQAKDHTMWAPVKPDIDNVEKSILDGMEGVVYKNDCQVVSVTKQKYYANPPGVDVEVGIM